MATLWEACAGKKWCIRIPFDGERCIEAKACIRVIEEGGRYFLELEAAGRRERMQLGASCVELRWYVFAAKVCLTNVQIDAHRIQFDVVLRLCVDADIGPIHIGECVNVYSQHVSIGFFTISELTELGFSHPLALTRTRSDQREYAYVETEVANQALSELQKQLGKEQ